MPSRSTPLLTLQLRCPKRKGENHSAYVFIRRAARAAAALLIGHCLVGASTPTQRRERLGTLDSWAVVYGPLDDHEIEGCDLVITDAHINSDRGKLRCRHVLGYVSLAEISRGHRVYPTIESKVDIIGPSPSWPDSVQVDVRSPQWRRWVLDDALPEIIAAGYDGVFFDTVNTACALEQTDPERFGGMSNAAAELIQASRNRYPDFIVSVNDGLCLLDTIAPSIDVVVVESIYGGFDWRETSYTPSLSTEAREEKIVRLQQIQTQYKLPILVVEYFPQEDAEAQKRVCEAARLHGFQLYMGPVDLQIPWPQPCPPTR